MVPTAGQAQLETTREWPWARLTAAAGILFVVFTLGGFVVRGVPPTPGESLAVARSYYVEHRTGVLIYAYLDSLTMLCLVAFASGLGGLAVRRGGDPFGILARLMLAGAIGMAGITMVLDMSEAALSSHTAIAGESAAVLALFDLVSMVALTGLPQALFLAGAAGAIVRSAVVPRWLGVAALVPAITALIGAAGLGNPGGPLEVVGLIGGYLPMLLWVLALSIILFVRREGSMVPSAERQAHAGNPQWQPEA